MPWKYWIGISWRVMRCQRWGSRAPADPGRTRAITAMKAATRATRGRIARSLRRGGLGLHLARHRQQHVGRADDRGEALGGVVRHADGELRAAGLVQRARDLLAQLLCPHRVELDGRHREPVAAERDRAGPGRAELDARLLEQEE